MVWGTFFLHLPVWHFFSILFIFWKWCKNDYILRQIFFGDADAKWPKNAIKHERLVRNFACIKFRSWKSLRIWKFSEQHFILKISFEMNKYLMSNCLLDLIFLASFNSSPNIISFKLFPKSWEAYYHRQIFDRKWNCSQTFLIWNNYKNSNGARGTHFIKYKFQISWGLNP